MAIEIISTLKPKNNGSFPIAEAADISVDENGTRLDAKLTELANNSGGSGGGGGGGGIIDVTELPTEGIDEQSIYRVVSEGTLYYNGEEQGKTYCVDELPQTGEPCTTDGKSIGTVYYNTADEVLYGYVPTAVGSVLGVPEGWYPAATLMGALGYVYGGVVASMQDMTDASSFYLFLQYSYHACKRGGWTKLSNKTTTFIELKTTDNVLTNASGILTDEQYTTITADPKNTAIGWVTGNQYLYKSFEANEKYLFTYLLVVNSDKTWSYTVILKEL